MVLAGALGEIGGQEEQVGALGGIVAEEFREAEVVADGHSAFPPFEVGHDRLGAGRPEVALADDLAGVELGLEKVDLPVGGGDFAPAVHEDAGIVDGGPVGFDNTSSQDPGVVTVRDGSQEIHEGAREGLGRVPVILVASPDGEHLGEGDEVGGPHAGEELFHPSEVGLDITPGPDLHQGDSQMM